MANFGLLTGVLQNRRFFNTLSIFFAGEFDIAFTYTSQNGTGTGEIDFEIDTVDKIPVGEYYN